MKNTNYIISGILAVAVIILFILQFSSKKSTNGNIGSVVSDSMSFVLPIAYVEVDSLLSQYNYSKDVNESILKKKETEQAKLNQKLKLFSQEVADFELRAQNNAFLNNERAMQEQERLGKKQQSLQREGEQMQQSLYLEQSQLIQQLIDTIVVSLKQYNEPKKYQVIFSKQGTGTILIAEDVYDITNEVVEFLNTRYVPGKK